VTDRHEQRRSETHKKNGKGREENNMDCAGAREDQERGEVREER